MSNGNFSIKDAKWVIAPLVLGGAFVAANNRFKLVDLDDLWTGCAGLVSGVAVDLILSRSKSPDKVAKGSFQYRSLVFPIAFYGLQAYLIRNELSEFRPYEWATPFTAGVAGILVNGLVGVNATSTVAQEKIAEHASDLFAAIAEELPQYSLEASKMLGEALRDGKDCLAARLMERFPNLNFLDPKGLTKEQIEFVQQRNPTVHVANAQAVGGDRAERVANLFTAYNAVNIEGPWSDLYGPAQEGKAFDYQLGVLQYWFEEFERIDQFNFVAAAPLLGEQTQAFMEDMANLKVAEVFENDVVAVLQHAADLESLTIHLASESDGSKLPVNDLHQLGELIIVSDNKIVDVLITSMGEKSLHCVESQHDDGRRIYTFVDADKLPANRASVSNLSFSFVRGANIMVNERE